MVDSADRLEQTGLALFLDFKVGVERDDIIIINVVIIISRKIDVRLITEGNDVCSDYIDKSVSVVCGMRWVEGMKQLLKMVGKAR
jgi:hypothetical protein